MICLTSAAGLAFAAELVVRWQIEDARREKLWRTPAYIRSWRASLAARTRRHGPLPSGAGMAPLYAAPAAPEVPR